MNLLIDQFPTSVTIHDVEYPVRWQFRTFLLIEQLLEDDDPVITDDMRLNLSLDLFFEEDKPEDIAAASRELIAFYNGGASPDLERESGKGTSPRRVLNYCHDHELIFTAFLRTYGVNLTTVDDLHWYEFKAMFQDLLEECQLVKVIGYRTINVNEIKDKRQRKFYTNMKRKYALPLNKKAREELSRIEKALLGDGDLSKAKG